jgi:hypothetical protein
MAKATLRRIRVAQNASNSIASKFGRFRIGYISIFAILILWLRTIITSDLFTNLINGTPATIMSAVEQAAVSAARPLVVTAGASSSSTSSSSSSLSSKIRRASRLVKRIDDEALQPNVMPDVVTPMQLKRDKIDQLNLESTSRLDSVLTETTTSTRQVDNRQQEVVKSESSASTINSISSLPFGNTKDHESEDPFFGSQIDLDGHRSNDQCWEHFDFGMLEEWDATNTMFCAPISVSGDELSEIQARDLVPPGMKQEVDSTVKSQSELETTLSWLRCRVTVDSHLPPPTAPHTMCDGANIVFDTNLLQPTHCLDSRSGYKCDGPPIHWRFLRGAFSPAHSSGCKLMPPFTPSSFPQDHLRDMFLSFSPAFSQSVLPSSTPIGKVVLLFARERAEHANPFHATTDFMNAFFSLHLAGVLNGIKGSRDGIEKVQVLLLDEQIGPYDNDFISTVFSPKFEVQRVSSLKKSGDTRILLPHAIFSPPGYSNFFLAHVDSDGDCHAGTQLLQSFRQFVLSAFPSTLPLLLPKFVDPATDPVTVTLISRRPYDRFVQHSFIGRQIDNEDELILSLSSEPGVVVTRHDFAQFKSVEEQLAVIAKTEVLVAMHGAALTYAIYLPAHASVLEFWPKSTDMWRCFEHIAAMSGLQYLRWANPDPSAFRVDPNGDYTRIDIGVVSKKFSELVKGARERRTASRK